MQTILYKNTIERADVEAALDEILQAVETANQIVRRAADKHMLSFHRQMIELTGEDIGRLEEPYLEFEIATFELQFLKILERLLGQVERAVLPTKNISPPVYGGRLRGGLYQIEDDLLQPPSRNLSSCFAGLDFFLPPQAGGEESPCQLKAIDRNSPITTQVEERIRIEIFRLEGRIGQKLDELRQQAVGLTHYIWHTQEDDRVRPTHAANDGELLAWDNPPAATGHPGHDYGCRCIAEPTLVDVREPKRIEVAVIDKAVLAAIIIDKLRKLGTMANTIRKALPKKAPLNRNIRINDKQAQVKYKHAEDFGLPKNYTRQNGGEFKNAIEKHVKDPNTKIIDGTYRGQEVTHYYNEKTGINVMKDSNGDFISGWRLDSQQENFLLSTGNIGGGKCLHWN